MHAYRMLRAALPVGAIAAARRAGHLATPPPALWSVSLPALVTVTGYWSCGFQDVVYVFARTELCCWYCCPGIPQHKSLVPALAGERPLVSTPSAHLACGSCEAGTARQMRCNFGLDAKLISPLTASLACPGPSAANLPLQRLTFFPGCFIASRCPISASIHSSRCHKLFDCLPYPLPPPLSVAAPHRSHFTVRLVRVFRPGGWMWGLLGRRMGTPRRANRGTRRLSRSVRRLPMAPMGMQLHAAGRRAQCRTAGCKG